MTERMRKVNELLREILSEAVLELKDPRIGFVTVTGVRTSPDLSHATVFVSVFGSERKRERSLEGLGGRPRRPAGPHRPRGADETDTDSDVRIRHNRRGGRADVKVDR